MIVLKFVAVSRAMTSLSDTPKVSATDARVAFDRAPFHSASSVDNAIVTKSRIDQICGVYILI